MRSITSRSSIKATMRISVWHFGHRRGSASQTFPACVANMPGAYARTSTQALTNATTHCAQQIADLGLERAMRQSPELAGGVNTHQGHVTYAAVAEAHGLPYRAARFYSLRTCRV